jgi:UDP-2,3-diacylglucosamine hydrolase
VSESASKDIVRGLEVLRALSPLDVGQACVVQGGVVLGIEGPEGTDGLIQRCGALKFKGPGPVLIKTLKLGQETRVDRSVIGPETIQNAAREGFSGIAIQGGGVIVLNAKETIDLANGFDVFLVGIEFPTESIPTGVS